MAQFLCLEHSGITKDGTTQPIHVCLNSSGGNITSSKKYFLKNLSFCISFFKVLNVDYYFFSVMSIYDAMQHISCLVTTLSIGRSTVGPTTLILAAGNNGTRCSHLIPL